MNTSVRSDQGNRKYMEDYAYVCSNLGGKGLLLGVICDGHGGSFCAQYVISNMSHYLKLRLTDGRDTREALKSVYARFATELSSEKSGTTVTSFLIQDRRIICANVGDSRVIVVGKDSYTQLTQDHRTDDDQEFDRIIEFGGRISGRHVYNNVRDGLMLTRSIGDADFKEVGVISIPYVSQYEISKDDLMLVAGSDGLFDVLDNEKISKRASRISDPDILSEALMKRATTLFGPGDNITVMTINLKLEV